MDNQPIPFVDENPFWIWLTADEIKVLSERAKESGFTLVSDFVKECLGFKKK